MSSSNPSAEWDCRAKKFELATLYLYKINAWLNRKRNKNHRNYRPFSMAQKALSGDDITLSLRTLDKMREVLELKFNRPVIDYIDLTTDGDEM